MDENVGGNEPIVANPTDEEGLYRSGHVGVVDYLRGTGRKFSLLQPPEHANKNKNASVRAPSIEDVSDAEIVSILSGESNCCTWCVMTFNFTH